MKGIDMCTDCEDTSFLKGGETMQQKAIIAGVTGGLVGGALFGMMMAMMGMLPMVAKLVGSSSAGVGFVVHMVISSAIGFLFAILLGNAVTSVGKGLVLGALYGVVWWVLGPLLIMPIMLGMGPQVSLSGMQMAMPSLFGHIIYGLVLGFVFALIAKPQHEHTHSVSAA